MHTMAITGMENPAIRPTRHVLRRETSLREIPIWDNCWHQYSRSALTKAYTLWIQLNCKPKNTPNVFCHTVYKNKKLHLLSWIYSP